MDCVATAATVVAALPATATVRRGYKKFYRPNHYLRKWAQRIEAITTIIQGKHKEIPDELLSAFKDSLDEYFDRKDKLQYRIDNGSVTWYKGNHHIENYTKFARKFWMESLNLSSNTTRATLNCKLHHNDLSRDSAGRCSLCFAPRQSRTGQRGPGDTQDADLNYDYDVNFQTSAWDQVIPQYQAALARARNTNGGSIWERFLSQVNGLVALGFPSVDPSSVAARNGPSLGPTEESPPPMYCSSESEAPRTVDHDGNTEPTSINSINAVHDRELVETGLGLWEAFGNSLISCESFLSSERAAWESMQDLLEFQRTLGQSNSTST